ncbi:hypothetical protein HG536_0C05410 [Torulaspora globosa]|uniref:Uncharacterized protein n=1 Tax=Torulaspora globosa TaxID=48254 RepID=A0A7G3ZFT6_9SACH|nr:uncharacterized protein HG536_0C05410 [Torulaspora globosa]QLL32372.1 hypothetical protein HG536_0C05410 [Torulaspora globosa]
MSRIEHRLMGSRGNQELRVQLVTPEEPTRTGGESLRSTGGFLQAQLQERRGDEDDGHLGDEPLFMPSVKSTRELECEIMETIHSLQAGQSVESERLVGVLNRSITAISHWSLQAQLAQLRGNPDDRQAVETSLLRKEMEFLIHRRPSAAEEQPEPTQGAMRTPPYSRSCESPRRPVKKPALAASAAVEDPLALTLVENKKPHPRMRRTSDNPSRNEYVRVFHLRRK